MGVDETTGFCKLTCAANQQLQGNQCVCATGYGYDANGNCVDCSTISGGFYLDGYCGICPVSFVYDGIQCSCPLGSNLVNGVCSAACQEGQLVDSSGLCYWCPINEVPVNGEC